jgi:hypothetical protein
MMTAERPVLICGGSSVGRIRFEMVVRLAEPLASPRRYWWLGVIAAVSFSSWLNIVLGVGLVK